jgi:hypothetical protein
VLETGFNLTRVAIALAAFALASCGSGNPAATATDEPPPPATPTLAPPSPPPGPAPVAVITGVKFNESSHRRLAEGSDNWPATWSDDDQQYAIWGDGGGFGGSDNDGRASFGIGRIEGDHLSYRGVNRYGGKNGECPSKIDGKSHGAPISIAGVLYAWVTPGSDEEGYRQFSLYKSLDKGCTWSQCNVAFVRADDGISYGSFVQAGKDNAAARDAYVYTVATVVTNAASLKIVQRPGNVALLRVPSATIEDRGTYEFFAGMDSTGQPIWSVKASDRAPIYHDAAGVGPFPQMSFVPGLDRWVYTNEHGDGVGIDARASRLTVAEAPAPWGPFNVVFKDVFFPTLERRVFQWNFAPKWFRDGGRGFTLIFSGDGGNDSWNTIDGEFIVQP